MMYTTACDLLSMIDVTRMVVASALQREETRGAHFRQDFPKQRDEYGLFNSHLRRGENGLPVFEKKPVVFNRKSLEVCQQYQEGMNQKHGTADERRSTRIEKRAFNSSAFICVHPRLKQSQETHGRRNRSNTAST